MKNGFELGPHEELRKYLNPVACGVWTGRVGVPRPLLTSSWASCAKCSGLRSTCGEKATRCTKDTYDLEYPLAGFFAQKVSFLSTFFRERTSRGGNQCPHPCTRVGEGKVAQAVGLTTQEPDAGRA